MSLCTRGGGGVFPRYGYVETRDGLRMSSIVLNFICPRQGLSPNLELASGPVNPRISVFTSTVLGAPSFYMGARIGAQILFAQ